MGIKKLYPFVVYSLKKSEKFKFINSYLPIYGINHETIDFRYFTYNRIQLNDEEIQTYFDLLYNFISKELFISNAENKLFVENFEKTKNKEKYLFRPYLQNYIELQLYMLILSISELNKFIAFQESEEEKKFYNKISDIISIHNQKSFYIRKNLDKYNIYQNDFFEDDRIVFNLFIINEKRKLEKSFIKIYELTIREINVTSNYERKYIELKNIMNKNLLNNRYLFINNKTEQQQKILEGKKPEYVKELIRFIFVPLKKENLAQYLKTAQTI